MTGDLVAYLTDADAAMLPRDERREHRAAFLAMLQRFGITPKLDTSGALMAPLKDMAQGFAVEPDEMLQMAGAMGGVRLCDPADLVSLH
jgi:hypothetical protein